MSKISSLTEGTSIVSTDLFRFVDVSDTTMAASGTNKKATAANVSAGLLALANLYYGSNIAYFRNGTTAQELRIANTYDGTNDEWGFLKWDTNVLKIGTAASGTGTEQALLFPTSFGSIRIPKTANDNRLDFLNSGGDLTLGITGNNNLNTTVIEVGTSKLVWTGNAVFQAFGGTSSSFPAWSRSSTTLQARLADDSGYASVQGKLTTETAYDATVPTPTGRIKLYDSTGTAYYVPAVAV